MELRSPEGPTGSSVPNDEVVGEVDNAEWLVRYASPKAVNKAGEVRRGAFTLTKKPAQLSVDRMAYADTEARARLEEKVRVFLQTGAVRTAPSPGNVEPSPPPPAHALIVPLCLPHPLSLVDHKDQLSATEYEHLSLFWDGLTALARSSPP